MATAESGSDEEQIYKEWCKIRTKRRYVIHNYNIKSIAPSRK